MIVFCPCGTYLREEGPVVYVSSVTICTGTRQTSLWYTSNVSFFRKRLALHVYSLHFVLCWCSLPLELAVCPSLKALLIGGIDPSRNWLLGDTSICPSEWSDCTLLLSNDPREHMNRSYQGESPVFAQRWLRQALLHTYQ